MKNIRRLVYFLIVFVLFIALLSYVANFIIFAEQPARLIGFSIVHFAGYLFFLFMPVEALFAYFISIGHNALIMILLAISTALLAQYIDYVIGLFFSRKIIGEFVSKKKFEKYKHIIHKWSGPSILLFNLLPLSSPVLLLVAGIIKYDMRKAFIYSFIGLVIKYTFIVIIFF